MSPEESSELLKVLRYYVRILATLLERSCVEMIGKGHREKERERDQAIPITVPGVQ